jgi:hypothetical protein
MLRLAILECARSGPHDLGLSGLALFPCCANGSGAEYENHADKSDSFAEKSAKAESSAVSSIPSQAFSKGYERFLPCSIRLRQDRRTHT